METWLRIYDTSLQDDSQFEIHEIQDAIREISERFGASLNGTAGLRGEMGVGSNRMNTTVVRRTSMGIAKYLLSLNIEVPLVVIGYDAANQFTENYAKIAADAFAMLGCEVFLFDTIVPTPLLSYSVPYLKCDVGNYDHSKSQSTQRQWLQSLLE